MPTVNLSSGGVRAGVRANIDLPASTLWKYHSVENEVTLCGSGEEADGICLDAVVTGELLNEVGSCYARKTTGVFSDVTIDSTFTCGGEFMSGALGVITAYVATSDNRPLGKFLSSGSAQETGKILFYSR